jgi:hypothetical protein
MLELAAVLVVLVVAGFILSRVLALVLVAVVVTALWVAGSWLVAHWLLVGGAVCVGISCWQGVQSLRSGKGQHQSGYGVR